MINKTLHLYWGRNRPLSFLRFMTVYSFVQLNPDWKVKVHVPINPSKNKTWSSGEHPNHYDGYDYLKELSWAINIVDFKDLGIPEGLSEVHKSDILRWNLLAQGGVWSDFDILYVRPFTDANVLSHTGVGLCQYRAVPKQPHKYQAIGFLLSEGSEGEEFFRVMYAKALIKLHHENVSSYQGYGAHLLTEVLEEYSPNINYIPPNWVYPYRMGKDQVKYFGTERLPIPSDTIGLHWYGGNPFCAKMEAEIDWDTYKSSPCFISRMVSKCRK